MKKKEELTLREHLRGIQSLGGKARWAGLSAEERSLAARKAVEARWAKKKALDGAPVIESASASEPKRVTTNSPAARQI